MKSSYRRTVSYPYAIDLSVSTLHSYIYLGLYQVQLIAIVLQPHVGLSVPYFMVIPTYNRPFYLLVYLESSIALN
jgi:hypothetical protein